MTKNLVVCCDGTWKNSDDPNVSNIEKIARSIAPTGYDGESQIVHYSRGVGAGGSRVERLLGGAFGLGLDTAIVECYRFLALNYEPGDRVFVFGFSRGAYTARSLCGMIAHVGLLTPMGVAQGELPVAMTVYRNRPRAKDPTQPPPVDPKHEKDLADLKAHCQPDDQVWIEFLGVFDTVGALGIPGLARSKYKFHDVTLSAKVRCARQALAIAERRRIFAPCLWGGHHLDIKQVWFDGVHSDVGGGYSNCYYSDKTLLWMAREAAGTGQYGIRAGMVFDWERLSTKLCRPDESVVEHNSMTPGYRIANILGLIGARFRRHIAPYVPVFVRGWRMFAPTVAIPGSGIARAYDVHVEGSAARRGVNPNMQVWFDEVRTLGGDPDQLLVSAPTLAEADGEMPASASVSAAHGSL
ncbi:T6SS phospholipase effector Tle1-like catalytic domain-containing protein [Gordonia sp. NPDC003425]